MPGTIVRSVTLNDVENLWGLIQQATYGLTTLQISQDQLLERVELSEFAFKKRTEKPTGEPYVLVMEDLDTGRLVGTSCIFSKTGGYEPFYSYRLVRTKHSCEALQFTHAITTLHLQKIHDGPTEIGSLFLLPEYRGHGNGRLLSLARFAFMAMHPKRFSTEVIAEMRGIVHDDGRCPFWDAIGRHFFCMDFPQADSLSTINKRFIEDMMPQYPIYLSLLAEEVREVIGQVHPNTVPALKMLEAEGFQRRDLIDIFDGGPVVHCDLENIDAVRRCKQREIVIRKDVQAKGAYILAADHDGFRALITDGVADAQTFSTQTDVWDRLRCPRQCQVWSMDLHPEPISQNTDS